MSVCDALAAMVAVVRDEFECDRALDLLVVEVLRATRSRNAMIARMNDELGTLELRHGAGSDWTLAALNERIIVDVKGQGIIAQVAATGSSFYSGDVSKVPQYRNLFQSSRSELAIPIRDRYNRMRAVLNMESDVVDRYDANAMRMGEVAAALASFVLNREMMRTHQEALVRIGNAVGNAVDEEDLIQRILKVAGEVLHFQACSIFMYDSGSGLYMLRGTMGRLIDEVGLVGYAPGEGCTGTVCQSGIAMLLSEPQEHPQWTARHVELPGEDIASFLAVPIFYHGKSVGTIRALRRVAENKYLDNHFTPDDLQIFEAIAGQFSAGLERIRSIQKIVDVERMAAWGELSAKSSHMIGNRVFAIKGDVNELGHLLNDSSLDIDALREIQKSLGINVVRIEEILQDFRDFVSATNLNLEPADIEAVVREAVSEVFPRRSNVRLEFNIEESLPPVEVDKRKLRRALSELVENSLSFFEEGKLSVKVSRAPELLVRRRKLKANRPYIEIAVEDQGPGVQSDLKDKIFEPFFSSRPRGMGLGLSIVKGIFQAHGGTVYEDGSFGGGARFVMLLPSSAQS